MRKVLGRSRLLFVLLVLAVALLASGAGGMTGGAGIDERPLYGLLYGNFSETGAVLLRELSPTTLVPVSKRVVRIPRLLRPGGRSPDGRFAAFFQAQPARLRVVDLEAMRTRGEVSLGTGKHWRIREAFWLTADRLVFVVQRLRGSYEQIVDARQIIVVDPLAGRVVARRPFANAMALEGSAQGGDKLVLLLGRGDRRAGRQLLAVAGTDGRVRTTPIELEASPYPSRAALVVAPTGQRAFVVGVGASVLDVDLASLKVTRRTVTGGGKLFRPDPSRFASRGALWVDERTLAVFGDEHAVVANGVENSRPAGLALLDTESWQARLVDAEASGASLSGGTLLAYGIRIERAPTRRGSVQRAAGIGLRAYETTGTLRWRRFAKQPLYGQAVRDIAVVRRIELDRPGGGWFPVDLAGGRQTGALRAAGENVGLLPEPAVRRQRSLASSARDDPALEVRGDGEAFTGDVRADVSKVTAVLVDGSERDLPLEGGQVAYSAASAEESARALRAYAGESIASTMTLPVRCGGSAGPCAAASATGGDPTYAFIGELPAGGTSLVRIDPRTLRPIGDGLVLPEPYASAYARSPDGTQVAVAVRERPLVRIVDLERLRVLRTIRFGRATEARALAWLAADRLVALEQRLSRPTGRYVRHRALVGIDPTRGKVVGRHTVTSKLAVSGLGIAGGRLVLKLSSSSHKGSTVQLVVADANGSIRGRTIEVGKHRGVLDAATLLVEPSGNRAFLVRSAQTEETPPVLDVDLSTLAVRARRLTVAKGSRPQAKIFTLPPLAVVGEGYIAAAGAVPATEGDGRYPRPAAGIFRIDTSTWAVRLLDPRAINTQVVGDRLITYGLSSRRLEAGRRTGRGAGVSAYDSSGRRLYHLYGDRPFGRLQFAASFGHILLGSPRTQRLVFDADTGERLGMMPALTRPIEVLSAPPPPPLAGTPPPAGGGGVTTPAQTTRAPESRQQADPFARVSNRGTRVPAKAVKRGEREHVPRVVFLLRRAEGRAVYRIGGLRPGYSSCYASGFAKEIGRLGSIGCGRSGFPTRQMPLYDMSIYQGSFDPRTGRMRTRRLRLRRLDGVAADGVAEIGLTDSDGDVVTRVPVVDNVYILTSPPRKATGGRVAYSSDGQVIYRTDARGVPSLPRRVRPTNPRQLAGFRIKVTLPAGWSGEIERSRAGLGRALLLAGNKLPARDARSVTVALDERDPRSRPAFSRVAAAPRLSPSDVRAAGRYGRVRRSFTLEGRQFTLELGLGTPRPARATLAAINRLLASLEVGAIAVPATAAPGQPPLQHGEADGLAVEVYRSGVVRLRFTSRSSRAYRLAHGRSVGISCLTFDSEGPWEPNAWGTSRPFSETLQVTISESARTELPYSTLDPATEPSPPFDGCQLSGSYGRRWNDPRGQRAPAEIAFTARGRRFFDERAVARDLALFVRSPVLSAVRRTLKRGGEAPSAASIARRLPRRVVPSRTPRATPTGGRIGIWSDRAGVLVISERAGTGKRLFVEIRGGRIHRHNLEGLAFVF